MLTHNNPLFQPRRNRLARLAASRMSTPAGGCGHRSGKYRLFQQLLYSLPCKKSAGTGLANKLKLLSNSRLLQDRRKHEKVSKGEKVATIPKKTGHCRSGMMIVLYPNDLKMRFQREIKVLEARQRLEALVVPKRQALTRHQGLLAPSVGSCCTLL